jgi:C4-type Zn-finger protein
MRKTDPKKLEIDLEAIKNLPPDWYEKAMKEEQDIKDAERKIEKERIQKIKCPSCKSTSKEHIQNCDNNGVIGPGYSSWVIDEYYVCNKCGIMFKDISKMKKRR